MKRPVGFTLLAALLTGYALCGVSLTALMLDSRDPRLRWLLLALAGAAFAASVGTAALAVWRLDRWAPAALVAGAVTGAALCVALPAASPAAAVTPQLWRMSLLGAALLAAFLLLMAWYVRARLRSPS